MAEAGDAPARMAYCGFKDAMLFADPRLHKLQKLVFEYHGPMEIISPEERVVLWRSVQETEGTGRRALLHAIAQDLFLSFGDLDLYDDRYKQLTVETLESLDDAGLFARDSVRIGLEVLHEDEDGAALLVAELSALLREASGLDALSAERRVRAVQMAGEWVEHLERQPATAGFLTVADVAARYGVSTQAVYKWLKDERIEAKRTPGGSWLIPGAQFESDERPAVARRRLDELQERLTALHATAQMPSGQELGEQMRAED